MEKEYKIKSTKMISPNFNLALGLLKEDIEEVELPYGITTILYGIFTYNTTIKKIILPESITELKSSCFYSCRALSVIEFKGTIEKWNSITKGSGWYDYTLLTEVICSDGTVVLGGI